MEWLITNINQDSIDENERILKVFEMLQPWLNFQLYEKQKNNNKESTILNNDNSFEEELRKHGASFEEINKIESEVLKEING